MADSSAPPGELAPPSSGDNVEPPGEDNATPPGENGAAPPAEKGAVAPARTQQSSAVAQPEQPRAARIPDGAWLGGVCTGLAQHLGWSVMVLRLGFVALTMSYFLGPIVYAVLWLVLPPLGEVTKSAPGLESAARTNKRTVDKPKHGIDVGAVMALSMLAAGLLWLVQASGMGLSQQLFWPIAFACSGVALVWRTADTTHDPDWKKQAPEQPWLIPFVARGRLLTIARVVLGMGLVGAAVSLVIASQTGLQELPKTLAMSGLALAGLVIVSAPWVYRSRAALRTAREEKVRADERADMAAHLHDSVLQTLALIQRQSEDPKSVQTLARRQERELRTWLYGDVIKEKTLKAALTAAAADVEDERGVPVELVCVGDCDLDEQIEAMLRAAREAMVNSAKHSGAAKIDVYAEVGDDVVEIFVRDRGKGFSMDEIGEDRMGVKGSIIARMERHGGKARIRSSAEDGTEVRLEMSR